MKHKAVLYQRQKGAALVTALIMLLVLTLIGITGIQTITLEEKMAGNLQDQNLALQAAEAGLRGGEAWLGTLPARPVAQTTCTAPCQVVWKYDRLTTNDFLDDGSWTGSAIFPQDYASSVSGTPRFIVQDAPPYAKDTLSLGQARDMQALFPFRITARGVGATSSARAILQTTYNRRF